MFAIDLAEHGHAVRLILEGEAVKSLREREGRFGELFERAHALGLIAGVCKTAAAGCGDAARDVSRLAGESGLAFLDGFEGHASIEAFVSDGYEVVVF